jgi:hypothetical protein
VLIVPEIAPGVIQVARAGIAQPRRLPSRGILDTALAAF